MRYLVAPMYLWDGLHEKVQKETAFVIENGKIVYIGSREKCKAFAPEAEVLEQNGLVLPGFIDAHDHGRAVSPIGFEVPDRGLELWLQDLWKLPSLDHETAAYFDGLQLASSGVTTVLHSHNINCWDDLVPELVNAAKGYLRAGIRCILCPPYLDQNKGIYFDRDKFIDSLTPETGEQFRAGIRDKVFSVEEYLRRVEELAEQLRPQIQANMVQIQLHPNGGQWCSDEALLRMRDYAVQHHIRIHMHLLETKYQAAYAQKTWGCSFIRHYAEIGFLGEWLSCAHMIWLTPEDEDLLAQYNVTVVNNPSSNIRLRSGIFPLRQLQEKKVRMALGLDGCALDDDQDYLREMRLAFYNNGAVGLDAEVDPMLPLKIATAGGAGMADGKLSPGVLQVGARADFVGISVEQLREPYADPDTDLLALLLHRGTRRAVDFVYVQGRRIYRKEDYPQNYQKAAEALRQRIEALRQQFPLSPKPWKREVMQQIKDFYRSWEEEQ